MTSLNHKALAAALFASLAAFGCSRDDDTTAATTSGTTDTTASTTSPATTAPSSASTASTAGTTGTAGTSGYGTAGSATDTTGTSTAGTTGTPGSMTGSATTLDFDTLDTNRDGMISQSELPADRSGSFAQYDTDGNQSLSRSELESMATAANDTDNDQ